MKHQHLLSTFAIFLLLFTACRVPSDPAAGRISDPEPFEYALVLHGGAGSMNFENMPEPAREIFHHALDSALQLGLDILKAGGSSLDAVEVVIRCLEDDSLFNAGKGAVFTSEGKNELDASIMTGHDLNVGAVAGVTDIRNPISAARAVMEQSEHVMMAGHGASVSRGVSVRGLRRRVRRRPDPALPA